MLSFRAASNEAVDALVDQVGGSATVADDLFSVATTLRSEPALRRFATDYALATEAKSGLVSEIYDGKVDSATLGLLKDAVGRRWTRTRDLADALEYVGVVAAVRSVRRRRRPARRRAVLGAHPRQRAAATCAPRCPTTLAARPTRPPWSTPCSRARSSRPRSSWSSRRWPGSARSVAVALEDYEKVAADVHGRDVATVQVARPLGESDEQRLTAALTAHYGRPVHLNVVVDPEVIGGIKVAIGGDVIDGTIASRLDDARRKIAG